MQDHIVVPIEMGHFTYSTGIWEDYIGVHGLKRLGKKKWRRHVAYGLDRLLDTFHPDDLVVGGGNPKKLKTLPPGCRLGSNANAFLGGFRLRHASIDLRRAA